MKKFFLRALLSLIAVFMFGAFSYNNTAKQPSSNLSEYETVSKSDVSVEQKIQDSSAVNLTFAKSDIGLHEHECILVLNNADEKVQSTSCACEELRADHNSETACADNYNETESASCACFAQDNTWLHNGVVESADIEDDEKDSEEELSDSVGELIDELDLSDLQQLVSNLTGEQKQLFTDNIKDKIARITAGEASIEYGDLFSYLGALFGTDIMRYMPMLLSVLTIVIAYGLLNSLKGKLAQESVERVVYFAILALILTIMLTQFFALVVSVKTMINSMTEQINIVMPILLTLMTATGARTTAAVFSPSVVVLGATVSDLLSYVVFPALIAALIFTVIGAVSSAVKLKSIADFFFSAVKWLFGTAFFVFFTLMSVQGITASVRDGISVRAAKFAVSKYVPVIGGYLSEGFNFVMAGNVLIKNAIGLSAVVMTVISVAPTALSLCVFSLTTKLTCALAEPLGGGDIVKCLNGFSKCSSYMAAILVGFVFMYLIFLTLTVCTGNLAF